MCHGTFKKAEKKNNSRERQHGIVAEYNRRSSPALNPVLERNYMQRINRDQRLARYFLEPPGQPLSEERVLESYCAVQGCLQQGKRTQGARGWRPKTASAGAKRVLEGQAVQPVL